MKQILLLVVLAFGFASCGTKEDPYTREQKEIDAYFLEGGLDYYQAFKISLRGTKAVGKDPEFDSARIQLLLITGYAMEAVQDSEISMSKYVRAGTEIYNAESAVEVLLKKDEDSLPTIMENISYVMTGDSIEDPLAGLLTESEEHLILGGLWFAGAHAHPDLALYELNRVKAEDIRDPQFKCLAEMTRSLLYLTNKWPYHAEESADNFLKITESEKDALIASPWPMVDANGNPVSAEQSWHQLRAIGFVLRGLARHDCEEDEKKEQSIEDFETFITEAEAGGLDHKVVDLVGLMVALEKEDADKATLYIEKLEARPDLTQEEKDLIAEIKPLVADMKTDDAKSSIADNGLLPSFAINLFAEQFMNLQVVKDLKASESGKKFIGITEIKAEELIPGMDAVDSLKKDAEGLMEKVF